MADDISTLQALASDLVERVRTELQSDSVFGVGAFNEKPMHPFGRTSGCNEVGEGG